VQWEQTERERERGGMEERVNDLLKIYVKEKEKNIYGIHQ
jgi:hypothetical protein